MHTENLFVGIAVFLLIGIFHPLVIKAEYYFGKRIWPVFLLCGIVSLVMSMFVWGTLGSILSVLGFIFLWSIKELFEQEKRVRDGRFPAGKHHKNER